MKIDHAVITAAGPDQRNLPFQTLVDKDGNSRSALAIMVREILDAGIEQIGIVIQPGAEDDFQKAVSGLTPHLELLLQEEPLGYGHALFCARAFTGEGAFLHLVSDHLPISDGTASCAGQLVEVASRNDCAVSAVHATRENSLGLYGTIGGVLVAGAEGLYEVERVVEKPTPTLAEQELVIPGMRTGHYQCFFGMHVLTQGIYALLENDVAENSGPIQLSPSLNRLAQRERYLAVEINGSRHNIAESYGLFYAQLALAMRGKDREDVLAHMVTLLANRG